MARVTGLEPAASGVTGRRSNQLSYTRSFKRVARYRTKAKHRQCENDLNPNFFVFLII